MVLKQASTVVLLSGGLDSSANLALAHQRGDRLTALTVNYGQRAWQSESQAARKISAFFEAAFVAVDLPFLGQLGGSALLDRSKTIPEVSRDHLDMMSVVSQTAQAVWVPNRNGVLVHLACAYAESMGAERVLVGFNREEGVTFPDNTRAFMESLNHSLEFSTRGKVRVDSLTVDMDKTEIVGKLRSLVRPFPFEWVWSCYFSGDQACGRCESCQRFLRATGAHSKSFS
ncbi:MAG: 7-cyano-7-deazaguanine synthase QueC [Bdellovibrionales bacterium]|nr:7-cyano-7-deazaguanine synthase QueC [Bdellovibrionales bacterium]